MRYEQSTACDYNSILNNTAPAQSPERRTKITPIPQRNKARKTSGAGKIALRIAAVGIVMFMVCFNIFTRAEICETKKQIDAAQSELDELDSEYISLQMKMKNIVSFSSLEEEAMKLGMQKKTRSQIHYIDVSGGDVSEVVGR